MKTIEIFQEGFA